ncbi:MAG: metallophosphoesterase, partial [Verrucomicrobiota bacterium]
MKTFKLQRAIGLGALALVAGLACTTVSADTWKFGVMSDTQWTGVGADQVNNTNNVAVSIINQLNPKFIAEGVKFVVQVGDLTEDGYAKDLDTRAAGCQSLYNAGIGFFPLRGNHEGYQTVAKPAAVQFTNDFPQTQGLGTNVHGAANFSSPDPSANGSLTGLSYSFDYNNARFVLLDQFQRLDTTFASADNAMVDQVPWIGTTLSNRVAGTHAFVFSHKQLMGENHTDSLFGANPASNTNAQNQFIGTLANTGVRYTMSGHDHVHQRSIITSQDTLSTVEEVICGSDSSKFYTPQATNVSGWAGQKFRENSVAQDLYRVTYYIVTVDGPKVAVDYYASDETFPSGNSPNPTPTLHFHKRESFGYSLNGQSFLVPQGQSYTNIQDSLVAGSGFIGTSAKILGGSNGSTNKDATLRSLTKEVSTGWSTNSSLASDVLTLWGATEVAASNGDTYALSLSYGGFIDPTNYFSGLFGLVSKDTNGNWVNAVNLNTGGNAQFVFGPYVSSYPLGTYGVDTNAGTVWAVVNYQGSFAAGSITQRTDFTSLRIATLSDIHYFAPNLLVSNGVAFQTYLAGDRKLLAESAAIDTAAIDAIIAQQPDILLVSGDLTKDGEYDSHIGVSNLLARVVASGTHVYVIPGNHDVNNANALSFDGATATPVPSVTTNQFSSIYAPFGYNTGTTVARDPNSLSYVVEPVAGLWILCMDSCQYSGGLNPTAGSFSPARLNWITNKLAYAQSHGKVVIGMMHHGLLEHFPGQKTLFPEYVVDNYTNLAPLFAGYGVKAVFTGHFHAQDIVSNTFSGNVIYDIETGSTVTYPCPYRLIDLQANGQLVINSHRITAVNYNLGGAPDFQTYAWNYLTNGMVPLSAYMLQLAPFSLDAGTANYLAPAVSEAMVDHYIGDEPGLAGATPATQSIVTGLLGGTPQQQQLGGAIYSILTDTAPVDNNLAIGQTGGELTGPANGTIIMSGAPTLAWAPIWGATSYHITVTGPGYSHAYDVAGTILALTSGLANGDYHRTVPPH